MSEEFEQLFQQRPESMEQLIEGISPDIYAKLKSAVELGKWSDGSRLSTEQIEFSMQAVIIYESKNIAKESRTGFDLTATCASKKSAIEQVETLAFVENDNAEGQP